MTDERIDALVRRLDFASAPDPAFVEITLSTLAPRVRAARERDRTALGRFLERVWRPSSRPLQSAADRAWLRAAGLVVALLILALIALLVVGGALRRTPFGNGPLVVSRGGAVISVDADSMEVRTTLDIGGTIAGLARSPDGRFVSFWTGASPERQFEVANVDGSGRRRLAGGLDIARAGCTDDWAPDSTRVATEVTVAGTSRILVADVRTGEASFVTPPDAAAHCPLWSPDGRLIAFQRDRPGDTAVVAVIAPDGSGLRDVSGDLDGLTDYGTNGWSPDGAFVFFGAGRDGVARVFRADVRSATSEPLTPVGVLAYAPSLSPDGKLVSFIVPIGSWWVIHVMHPDGSDLHQVLQHATGVGWSPDGRYIVAEWYGSSPEAPNGGLMLITPDGGERRVVLPFAAGCPTTSGDRQPRCVDGVSWGLPTP